MPTDWSPEYNHIKNVVPNKWMLEYQRSLCCYLLKSTLNIWHQQTDHPSTIILRMLCQTIECRTICNRRWFIIVRKMIYFGIDVHFACYVSVRYTVGNLCIPSWIINRIYLKVDRRAEHLNIWCNRTSCYSFALYSYVVYLGIFWL